jgi:hypothetical protein
MGTNDIAIQICNSPEEAPHYARPGDYAQFQNADIIKAVIVRGGTATGNDTVDLQFVTADGRKHVAMITARILKQITNLTVTDKGN